MIVAGIVAALIILLSPAFQQETSTFLSDTKNPAEKSGESEKHIVAVPSDAVTSSQAGTIEHVNPFVVQEIIDDAERQSDQPLPTRTLLTSFFKTLLRTVISSQAP